MEHAAEVFPGDSEGLGGGTHGAAGSYWVFAFGFVSCHGAGKKSDFFRPLQQKSDRRTAFSDFSDRTDRLADALQLRIADLTEPTGISRDMIMAYRKGRHEITEKAWRKLEAAEMKAGIRDETKPEPYRVIEEAPEAVQEAFFKPGLAWPHYLEAESLLDYLLAERTGKAITEEERASFVETLRHFMEHRERGRKALFEATKLAEDIGNRVLGQWMGAQGQPSKAGTSSYVAAKVAEARRLREEREARGCPYPALYRRPDKAANG